MQRWREGGRARTRRRAVFALALLAHGAIVVGLLHTRARREPVRDDGLVTATIWLPPARPARAAPPMPVAPPAPPRPDRLHANPRAVAGVGAVPVPEPQAITVEAPLPPASAASAPLDLTLSRQQLRALGAGRKPTLAETLARPPAPSALATVGGGDAPYVEKPLPHGETEVQVHGGCFRLVPTPRSQYDPFNHAGERLTADCAR